MMHMFLKAAAALLFLGISFGENEKNPKQWDHFIFAQEWPKTICINSKIAHKDHCVIPAHVTSWSIHGLWPTNGAVMGPSYCNNASKFDIKQLQGIEGQLNISWPNLFDNTRYDCFWKYEWIKHGTCAASHPQLHTQLAYFSKALEIKKKYDILQILKDGGVVPGVKSYSYAEVSKALKKKLQTPKLSCAVDKKKKTYYLAQVSFCLDRSFRLIHCPAKDIHFNSFNYPTPYNAHMSDVITRNDREINGKLGEEKPLESSALFRNIQSSQRMLSSDGNQLVDTMRMTQVGWDTGRDMGRDLGRDLGCSHHKPGELRPCPPKLGIVFPAIHSSE